MAINKSNEYLRKGKIGRVESHVSKLTTRRQVHFQRGREEEEMFKKNIS